MKYMYPLKIGSIIITWPSWRTSGSTSMVRIWFLEHSISWGYCTCDLSRKVYFFWQIVTLSKVCMALAPYFGDGVFNQKTIVKILKKQRPQNLLIQKYVEICEKKYTCRCNCWRWCIMWWLILADMGFGHNLINFIAIILLW